jgi:hypothetical protein
MSGMDHSKMSEMDHSTMPGMDHSKMAGMDHTNVPPMQHDMASMHRRRRPRRLDVAPRALPTTNAEIAKVLTADKAVSGQRSRTTRACRHARGARYRARRSARRRARSQSAVRSSSFAFPGDPFRPYELRLAQTLVDLIQLPRRRALGRAAFDAAKMRVTAEVLRFAADVRAAYFDLLAASQHVAHEPHQSRDGAGRGRAGAAAARRAEHHRPRSRERAGAVRTGEARPRPRRTAALSSRAKRSSAPWVCATRRPNGACRDRFPLCPRRSRTSSSSNSSRLRAAAGHRHRAARSRDRASAACRSRGSPRSATSRRRALTSASRAASTLRAGHRVPDPDLQYRRAARSRAEASTCARGTR